MGESDMDPPIPPKPSNYEGKEEEAKEKKGFFKRVFKKKEEKTPKEEKIEAPIKEEKAAEKDLDEISKLIDDTINDIEQLQDKNVPKADSKPVEKKEEKKPKTKEKPKEVEIVEPPKMDSEPKIAKLDVASIEGKPEEKKKVSKVAIKKPVPKPVTKKAQPKPAIKKAIIKPVKTVKKPKLIVTKKPTKKSYALPKFGEKKPVTKPIVVRKTLGLDTESQIALVKQELKNIPKNPVNAKNAFVLQNGKKLLTLKDLSTALSAMSEEIWNHHVSGSKNDFASWIKGELKSPSLANKVRAYFIKGDTLRAINQEINEIPNRANTIKLLETKVASLGRQLVAEKKNKKFSSPPEEFFKVDNKLINNINDLSKSMNNIGSQEYAAYVTSNKENFKKWLNYLTRDYQKEVSSFKKQYANLHTQVIKGVNDKVEAKIKQGKTEVDKLAKQKQTLKADLTKLEINRKTVMSEQKTLADKKRRLLSEIAQVSKEHKQVHALREKTQNEKDLLHNQIQDAQKELKKQKIMLEQQTKDAKFELANEEKEHRRVLAETKKQAKEELKGLETQIKGLNKQVHVEEAKIKREYDALEKKKTEISARDDKSKDREALVNKRESAFESEKIRIENLVKNFEEREKEIELKKSELEVAGFQKYLEGKLSEIQTSDAPGSFDTGIKAARNMVTNNDVDGAKRKYLELKADFEASGLSGAEKDRVFNMLRELYDDIMLAINN